MTNNSPLNLYSFHPHTAEVYTAVHKWLATQKDAEKYKSVRYPGGDQRKQQMEDLLNEPTLKMAAAQYNIFFPTHYFKVLYTLENIVTLEKICNWFTCNPHLYFIDIGCGAGAASAAFLQTTLSLVENQDICLIHPLYISCVGIDVNKGALPLYNQLMIEFQKKLIPCNINLEFTLGLGGIRENILTIRNHLIKKREKWNQPCLSNILMFQSNVIDMLEQEHSKRRQEDKSLIGYNVNSNVILSDDKWFADDYAMVYKQLFEEIPADLMHTITIGTSNSDNHRVKEMGAAISKIFGSSRHQFESLGKGTKSLTFKNPQSSYWEYNQKDTHIYFHVDVSKITSVKLEEDQDWHKVTSSENLELAWVRARRHLLNESLCDEVEIRLFEKNLERNLNRLQVFLVAYVKEVDHEQDYISYPFPKKISQVRWRGLSRLEEEILSVAIIQKLGNKVADLRGSSYAYRMAREYGNKSTEYLYSRWLDSYKNFIEKACDEAQKYQGCVIIRADIKSFYTHIIQDKLISLVSQELTESKRIRWLLRLLLSKKLNEHDLGSGVTQGHIGSGFYANVYLTSIDMRFGSNNEWGLKFFRYVDDMIIVIPDPEDEKDVLEQLKKELQEIGLELNEDKTEIFQSVSDFLEICSEDEDLTNLGNEFQGIINLLWIMNSDYRTAFKSAYRKEDDKLWWHLVEQYQYYLQSLKIYIHKPDLSRRINSYIFNSKKRLKDLKKKQELNLPSLPDEHQDIINWKENFENANINWKNSKDSLTAKLVSMFCESWQNLQALDPNDVKTARNLQTRIRFAFNRLSLLGITEIAKYLADILCQSPWTVREPLQAVESLARQGCLSQVVGILAYYQDTSYPMSEYMRAVTLRSLRFLPEMEVFIWEKIVEFATLGTLVERLMSTETWIALGYISEQFVEPHHIDAVLVALHGEPTPTPRLKKNYLLILGLHDSQLIKNEPINNQDYLLDEARNLVLEESVGDLFSYQEPQIIREKYYSGKRQSEIGDEVDYPIPR